MASASISMDDVPARTLRPIVRFREILPDTTTTAHPKLQQAWMCLETGELEWQTIERVVVSAEEFANA